MLCEDALDLIEPLLDDELEAPAAERLRNHLEGCPSCSREAAAARQLLTELRSLPEFDPPARVLERLQAATERSTLFSLANHRNRKMAWLAAAAALVLAVGALTIDRRQPDPTDAEALRAAAEVTFAIAYVGAITQRANRAIRNEVIDHRVVPVAARALARPFQRLSNDELMGGTVSRPPEHRKEGNS
jgi:anti-sigma factor RsiW